MQSTSATNAATASRSTTDDEQRGTFFFGNAAPTLVTLGLERAVDVPSPRCARGHAHASGSP